MADAQALPFPDGEFDVVLSCVGAMFAPDHEATARELLRVCRPGGTIAMANWTPGGEVGRFFAILARYGPTGPGPAPTAWGDPAHRHPLCSRPRPSPRRARTSGWPSTGRPPSSSPTTAPHFPPLVAFAPPTRQLDAELIDLYSGGYDLEYLTVLAGHPADRCTTGSPDRSFGLSLPAAPSTSFCVFWIRASSRPDSA